MQLYIIVACTEANRYSPFVLSYDILHNEPSFGKNPAGANWKGGLSPESGPHRELPSSRPGHRNGLLNTIVNLTARAYP